MPVWTPDNGNGTFTNPILWGDWPDPDVIRVGDTFYFVSISMHYVPGCSVLTSKDLVNWKMAGNAVDRYDEDPRYDMKGGNLYLNGSWAATIRHHNGKFYVGFCTPYGWDREKGNFSVCIADHVEGPWERVIFPEYLYDPGFLFDGFYYSLDNKDFIPIGNVLSMGLGLPWTANRFTLFHFTTEKEEEDSYADFNWFRFTNK